MNTNKLAKEALLGLGILIGIYLCVVPTEILTLSSQIFGATLIMGVIVFSFVEYPMRTGINRCEDCGKFICIKPQNNPNDEPNPYVDPEIRETYKQ